MRIGIDLGGTKIEGVVMNARGEIVDRKRIVSPSQSYAAICDALCDLVSDLSLQPTVSSNTPIGIGTPGAWQPERQSMKNCNSTVLNGQPLLTDLESRLGPRVRLANDANCFALSEAVDGAGQNAETVFGVILGTGVGGGIVINKKLLFGRHAIAGEWGHTPLPYLRHGARSTSEWFAAELADRDCYCLRQNCVETFLSGPGLARSAEELLGKPRSAEVVFSDPDAKPILDLYIDMLAAALAQVINLLDPDVVVLGGGLSKQAVLYASLKERLGDYVFSPECRTEVVAPNHGDSGGVRGAAWLWGPEHGNDEDG